MEIHSKLRNATSIPELFFARVSLSPKVIAYEYESEGEWRAVDYATFGKQVKQASLGIRDFGVQKGDCVAIWGDTMPEWTVLDLATLTLGAHVAGIYQTSTPEQSAYIINDSRAKVLCCDTYERLQSILAIRDKIPTVKKFIVWSGDCPSDDAHVTSMQHLYRTGEQGLAAEPDSIEKLIALIEPETYANLVYTSGTTGKPKGVVLTQGNCVSVVINMLDTGLVEEGDTTIAYLPLSHVAEYMSFLTRLLMGMTAYFQPDFAKLGDAIRAKKPTVIVGVPRVYEKVYQRIMANVNSAPPTRQRLFNWARRVGTEVTRLKQEGKSVPLDLALQHAVADRLVCAKVRAQLGGRIQRMITAAAPCDPEIIEFFHAFGIPLLEAYGLSETSGASHANRPYKFKIGTVGLPIDGTEQRIAEDGEILMRSPAVFNGYLNQPEATAEVLDADGWFHTGDIGEIDEEGFLRITDRKKNLLITAGGKNVAPAGIETLINRDPLVSQVVVLGDRKPYLVALITANQEIVSHQGLTDEQIHARITATIEKANKELAKYEQVKSFRIIPREFSIEDGEMTPTMKLKRNVIIEHWREQLDDMYAPKEEKRETVEA
jgi:long-chain acyl-CoA synthetase